MGAELPLPLDLTLRVRDALALCRACPRDPLSSFPVGVYWTGPETRPETRRDEAWTRSHLETMVPLFAWHTPPDDPALLAAAHRELVEALRRAATPAEIICTRLGEDSSGEGLGVVFKAKEGGKMVDTWPVIKRIDPGVVQGATPGLAAGWRLLEINGRSVEGMLFKEAAPLTKGRPLELRWQAPTQRQPGPGPEPV